MEVLDIVERLRTEGGYTAPACMAEAADEIERLRKIAKAAQQWRQYAEPGPIPAVAPQAMDFTTKHHLMRAVDEYFSGRSSPGG